RRASAEVLGIEPHQLEQLGDTLLDPLLVPAEQPGHGGHVVGNAHVRKQADVLNDVAHAQPKDDGGDASIGRWSPPGGWGRAKTRGSGGPGYRDTSTSSPPRSSSTSR